MGLAANSETYPAPDNFLDDCENNAPKYLRSFIKQVITYKKAESKNLGNIVTYYMHGLAAKARPNSFYSPLQIAESAYFYRRFGSREAVNLLHALGIGASYYEVQKLQDSILKHSQMNDIPFEVFISLVS